MADSFLFIAVWAASSFIMQLHVLSVARGSQKHTTAHCTLHILNNNSTIYIASTLVPIHTCIHIYTYIYIHSYIVYTVSYISIFTRIVYVEILN